MQVFPLFERGLPLNCLLTLTQEGAGTMLEKTKNLRESHLHMAQHVQHHGSMQPEI